MVLLFLVLDLTLTTLSTMFASLALFVLAACSLPALANPTESNSLHARQDPQNIVYITSVDKHCIIVPRDAHTNVGDSEHPYVFLLLSV